MKLESVGSNVVIKHGGQELLWNVKILERSKRSRASPGSANVGVDAEEVVEEVDPFYQLNHYLAYLPFSEQQTLFNIYQEINDVFENSIDFRELMTKLAPAIKKIFDLCTEQHVAHWVRVVSSIIIPNDIRVHSTIEESIAADDDQYGIRNRPVESTYLRDDYWNLIVLIMMLRLIMPIWGRFMSATVEVVGNDLKELYALKLIGRTSLIETSGYKRLEAYVNVHMSEEKIKNSVIAGKVSTEDFPALMMALVTVRRLAWVDFSGYNQTFSLVAWVYSFVDQNMNSMDRALNEAIKPKIPENGIPHGDHENRQSVFELVKVKEPIATGRIGILEAIANRPHSVAQRLCPDMPMEYVDMMLSLIPKMQNNPLPQGQVYLLQLVMGVERKSILDGEWDAVFPSRGVDELTLLQILNLMAVAAAFLWHRGYQELAVLMMAGVASERHGALAAGAAAPAPLTPKNKELLAIYYPHIPRPSGKKRIETSRVNAGTNVAIENIEIIREHLSRNSWLLNLPNNWLSKIPGHNGTRRYAIRSDIRNRLADLSIRIVERSI